MAGTKVGGAKAAETNKALYGENFYAEIGKKGGRNGHTGGFFANRELARTAGAKGGKISRRGKVKKNEQENITQSDKARGAFTGLFSKRK